MYFYLLLINALALLFMCLDKQFAKLHKRRIPEAVLLGAALSRKMSGYCSAWRCFTTKRASEIYLTVPLLLAAHRLFCCFGISPRRLIRRLREIPAEVRSADNE